MKPSPRTTIIVTLIIAFGVALFAQRGGRKVSGTVISAATNQPLAGVPVQYEEGSTTETTRTDEKGYFEFDQPGTLGVVIVSHPRYATTYRRWPADRGQLQIRIASPAVVTGTVRDANTRRPIAADVTVLVEEAGSIVSISGETEGATYTVRDVPSGPAVLLASSNGFAPGWSTLTVGVGDTHTANMNLLLEAVVSGTVVDADGDLVRGAEVFVTYPDEAGAFGLLESFASGGLLSDADGKFYLLGLIPDVAMELQAQLDDGTLSNVVTVTVGPGMEQQNLVLSFP